MAEEGSKISAFWRDKDLVDAWVRADRSCPDADPLALPRALAVGLVADDGSPVRTVVDVASGAGTFLEAFLKAFPEANGIWCDASPAMLEVARTSLASAGARVSYQLFDMTDLGASAVPWGADVLLSSRATHHLCPDDLMTFYQDAVERVRPGGWVINLDVVGVEDGWRERFRSVRRGLRGDRPEVPPHPHQFPFPTPDHHRAAFRAAGVDDVAMVWKSLHTCLFAGRKGV